MPAASLAVAMISGLAATAFDPEPVAKKGVRPAVQADAPQVSFDRDIALIFRVRCLRCLNEKLPHTFPTRVVREIIA